MKRKKKPAPRNTHKPLSGYEFGQHCVKLIKARIDAGLYRDDPALEAALATGIESGLDPVVPLLEIIWDPRNDPETRGALDVKLLPYRHTEQSLFMKQERSAGGDTKIEIIVKPGYGPTPVKVIDVTPLAPDPDAPRLNSTPPSPEPEHVAPIGGHGTRAPGYADYTMQRDSHGVERPILSVEAERQAYRDLCTQAGINNQPVVIVDEE